MPGNYILPIILFLASQTVVFITACIVFYTKVQVKIREFEIRMKAVENQDAAILKKLDRIAENIQEINLQMQNKKDRDN